VAEDRDDLDDLVRTAMKALDEHAPSGYFEALPGRILARLAPAEGNMQAGTTSGTEASSSTGVPPTPEEDSGLHDIRNLAASTMERIESKRISASTIKTDDELLASTSGSWKNLALPQPASMISLPEIAELPPVEKADNADKAKPVVAAQVAKRASSRKGIAIAGVGLAAAAGVTLFLTMHKTGAVADAPTSTVAQAAERAAPAIAASPAAMPAPAPIVDHIDEPATAGNAAAAGSAAVGAGDSVAAPATPEPPMIAKASPKKAALKAPSAAHAAAKPVAVSKTEAPEPAETKTAPPAKAKSGGDESFDALLKEAGVNDNKKDTKPVLEKKELSAADFKAGMAAIQSKAQACFKGTQGQAQVKLVVAPSGKVSRVTVSGVFADKPEAACVTAAVKSATFPPWDGGSQTMGYSFLLSE
jgi:hypothetical protein